MIIQIAKTAPSGTDSASQPEPVVAASTTPSTMTFMVSQARAAGAKALKSRMDASVTNSPGDTSQSNANTRGTTAMLCRQALLRSATLRVATVAMSR